jgi:hypothetical protein
MMVLMTHRVLAAFRIAGLVTSALATLLLFVGLFRPGEHLLMSRLDGSCFMSIRLGILGLWTQEVTPT